MKRFSAAAAAIVTAWMLLPRPGHAQNGPGRVQIVEISIADIQAAYKARTLTARALVQAYLDRIAAYDQQGPSINSIITLNDRALAEADALDAALGKSGPVGPLHGIPVLVKDEIDAAGMPTTLGSLVFKDYRPPRDAFVVAQLKKAGAIILGKTTLGEYAAGDTYGSLFGATRNPYDLARTAGGSSGGSGAALAANFSTVAVGEETAASIRRPGGWNGVASLRPTPGLVSRSGMWDGYPRPNAQAGPMARTVTDLAKLLDVMAGYDPEDPLTAYGVAQRPATYTASLDKNGLRGARLGVVREVMGGQSNPESPDFKKMDAVFEGNLVELRSAGAVLVDPVVIPDRKALMSARESDSASSDEALKLYLSRNPSSPLKTREDIGRSPDVAKAIPPSRANQWTMPPSPDDPARQVRYLKAREQLMTNVMKLMADNRLDALVFKTVEQLPPLLKEAINPPYVNGTGYISMLNTFLIHVAAMTVPSGFTSDGIPAGITFLGRPFSEPTLLKLAYSYEQATHHRRPPPTTPALAEAHR